MNMELISMNIISNAGEAKALAFDALNEAKRGNFEEARKLLKDSETAGNTAHKAQMDLLVAQANGEVDDVNILLVHAQDHLMTTLLGQELIKEMIEMYERGMNK